VEYLDSIAKFNPRFDVADKLTPEEQKIIDLVERTVDG
jgi:hypothetical protein